MSQRTSEKTTIEGVEFEVFMLDPFAADSILHDLAHILGPSVGDWFGALAKKELSGEKSAGIQEGLAGAVGGIFRRLEHSKTKQIMETLASVTVCDGGKLKDTYAITFQGRIGLMYKWAGFALKVQYQDFFDSAPAVIDQLKGLLAAAQSESQIT